MRGRVISYPAPVGGWNTRDSLDEMPPQDAVTLTNWFPTVGKVEMRKGYSSSCTGHGGSVETLAEYHAGSTRKLLSAANGNIWDSSSSTASSLASGFSSNRWQTANFNGSMGWVNGADAPQVYDGSTVSSMTVSGSGLSVANLVGINVFKSRTYFWENNSQDFWYSAVNALGGSLTKFPLSRVGQFGGNLTAMGTWTLDGGNGPDDYAVFIMSSGEVIVYQGSDPGSSTDWSIVGVYRIGAPLSVRSVVKVGGELYIITRDDYIPMSSMLAKDRVNYQNTKAVGALRDAVSSYGSNFGWQAVLYPVGNMLIFNVPVSATLFHQHVMNTTTKAWTKFTNMNGVCWATYNDSLYFGGTDGIVYKADTGTKDGTQAIAAQSLTAWNYLKSRGKLKQFHGIKPTFSAQSGSVTVSVDVGVDFKEPLTVSSRQLSVGTTTAWGDAWGSPWSAEVSIIDDWLSGNNIGFNVAAKVNVTTSAQTVTWNSTNYLYEYGGLV